MSEYSTYYNGKWTQVYNLDDCIRAIQCRNPDNEDRIKRLTEENRKLKEEYNNEPWNLEQILANIRMVETIEIGGDV